MNSPFITAVGLFVNQGGVVSHTLLSEDGARRTVGIVRKEEDHFTTDGPERMDLIAGVCRMKLAGEKEKEDVYNILK